MVSRWSGAHGQFKPATRRRSVFRCSQTCSCSCRCSSSASAAGFGTAAGCLEVAKCSLELLEVIREQSAIPQLRQILLVQGQAAGRRLLAPAETSACSRRGASDCAACESGCAACGRGEQAPVEGRFLPDVLSQQLPAIGLGQDRAM